MAGVWRRRIEIAVGFAIVGVAIALTAPAVVSVCNSAGHIRCQINHQHLAMALHVRADSHAGRLPSLTDGETGRSWMFELLPYSEQDALYRKFAAARPEDFRAENGPASTRIVTFLCRTDATEVGEAAIDGRFAPTNYAINGMVVGRNDATFKDTFRDGTSNTILLAERARNCAGVSPLWAWASDGPELPAFAYLPAEGGASSGMFAPDVPIRVDGRDRVLGVIGSPSARPGTVTRAHAWQLRPTSDGCDPTILQSAHAAVISTALADGSVRVISRRVSQRTFWQAVTPAGGEVLVGTDW